MQRLLEVDCGSEIWKPRLEIWQSLILHHIKEKEELLPKGKKEISDEQVQSLTDEFKRIKEEAMSAAS